jgi:cytochrome c
MPTIKRMLLTRHDGKRIWPKLPRNGSCAVRISSVVVLVLTLMPANAANERSAVASGKSLVERYCSGCHAVGRSGESRHLDAPAFRTLSKRYPLINLEEALAEGISTGHPDMPEFQLRPSEISSVIQYLDTIQEK